MKRIVVIGGGTGTYTILSGLKNYNLDLSVIVSMMDSGGSTGRLRDQLGVLPPGDLRQCLVALSDASDLWRRLFLYRFDNGDLKGHNFGNLLITALEKNIADYNDVIKTASLILDVKGDVLPVTLEKSNLCVEYENGEVVVGESLIDKGGNSHKISKCFLEPTATANAKAVSALKASDYIIIGPGDLYTSLIPNLLVTGIKDALVSTKAKIIYVVNLMTKKGQTEGYTASEHLRDLELYLGRKSDFVITNKSPIPPEFLEHYRADEEMVVENDMTGDNRVVCSELLANSVFKTESSDTVTRSLIRHDPQLLAKTLMDVMDKDISLKQGINHFFRDVLRFVVD